MAVTDIGWCRFWFDDDGRFHLQLETDQASGMVIEQAIGEARDHLFNNGQSDVTMPDAVLEMAQRSLDAIDSPDRRNRWRINLHLRTDGRCTDGTGHFLPDAIRRYLTCDGMLTPTFFDGGIPVSVGRSQHIVPDRTRRVVIERATAVALSRVATSPTISRCITSSTGTTTVPLTRGIWVACVPTTTGSTTRVSLGISGNADIAGGRHLHRRNRADHHRQRDQTQTAGWPSAAHRRSLPASPGTTAGHELGDDQPSLALRPPTG